MAQKEKLSTQYGQQHTTLYLSLRNALIMITTIIIVFAAAKNTITWHCQRLWGVSGDFWQTQWDKFLDIVGDDPFNLWVYGTTILQFCVYWIVGAIYVFLDVTNIPTGLRKYKTQPGKNEPVDTKRLTNAIWHVFFNQTVVTLPFSILIYYLMQYRGSSNVRELPTFHWVLYEMIMFILIEEIGFYYSHRLFHSKYLYKYIHKKHHEWTAPIAIIAAYCHPIEHIFSNMAPVFLGVFIMGAHIATAWLWFVLAILSTLKDHSGYHMPFLPSPEAHDYHHLKYCQKFWEASGDFWQTQWDRLLDIVGDDPFKLWVYGTTILQLCVYWIFGSIFMLCDIRNKPAFLRKLKMQPGKNEPVDTKRLLKVIRCVLFNQTVVEIPFIVSVYHLMHYRNSFNVRELPTFHKIFYELVILVLMAEIGYYYSHRFLHKKYLYKYVHKQHHEWTAPIAVVAAYCHPLEHMLSNTVPLFLGVVTMGSHIATTWLWLSLAISSTLNDHSGYRIPFFLSQEAHNFHHSRFNECYGAMGILDRLHGTDENFRKTYAYAKHTVTFNFVPARKAVPN